MGNLLSDAGSFLQQPSASECDTTVEYFNPHYLTRPGARMPTLNDSVGVLEEAGMTEILDEVNKNQLMQIFDHADANDYLPSQIIPSPRLRSTLRE